MDVDIDFSHYLTVSSTPGSPLSALAYQYDYIINNHYDYTLLPMVTKVTLSVFYVVVEG